MPAEPSRLTVLANRLRVLDITTVYPLLLMLGNCRGQLRADAFDGMLVDIESYLVRRAICGLTPKNYNRIFVGIIRALGKNGGPSRQTLQSELLALQGDSTVWPDDRLLRQHWLDDALYLTLGPAKTRMAREALDLAMQTSKQEEIHIEGGLTVEHVLPQWGSLEDWPYPARADQSGLDPAVRRARLIHSIGNLTLLTQPLNSSASNGPFRHKRPAIAMQSRLQLNAYFQRFRDDDAWHEETIIARGQALFALATTVWPYPATAET